MLPIALYLVNQSERERDRLEQEERETRLQLEQSRQLISSLEAQRHDFKNQLQMIWGLATMGRVKEIQEYIKEYGAALENETALSRLGNTVLQALFLSFQCRLREVGIQFKVSHGDDLSEFKYPPVKIARICSNILQNAAEAVAMGGEQPLIQVSLWQDLRNYHFEFWNNGPAIPAADLDRIFAPGFSSKGGEGRGHGLFIVKTLTEELGGSIAARSDEANGTAFHLWFPRKPRSKSPAATPPKVSSIRRSRPSAG